MPPPVEWERAVGEVVSPCSPKPAGPYDRDLSGLVGELSTRSEAFRPRRAAHNVRFHNTEIKRFDHPVVGDPVLSFETMKLSAGAGLTMAVYPPSQPPHPTTR